jgi:MFS family permease
MEARPIHDRPTWITYAQLGLFSWYTYALGATLALLRDDQDTSRWVNSLHGSSAAVGGIIGGLLTARAIDRWGRGHVLRIGALLFALGLAIYSLPGVGPGVTIPGLFLVGFVGSFVLISINAFLLDHQGAAGPASLTEANAIASFTGLIGPLIVGLGAATFLGWRVGIWVIVVGFVLVEILRGNPDQYGMPGMVAHDPDRRRLPHRVYWTFAVIMCFLATEFSLVYWSADLLRERADFGPAAAAASLTSVTSGMLIGRWYGSRLARRMSTDLILKASIVVAIVGFAIAWLSTIGWLILIGLCITGIGIGVHWPLGVARAVRASGGLTDRATAASSVAGSVAIAIAPFALGFLSEAVGFHTAFLLVPAFLVTALILMAIRPVDDSVTGPRVVPVFE